MTLHPHLQVLAQALDHERAWQQAEHRRLAALPLDDQVAHGFAWPPVEVLSVEDAGRGRTLLQVRASAPLHDGIRGGEPVWATPAGATGEGVPALVLDVEGRLAEVLVQARLEDGRPQVISRRFDPTTFLRYRDALLRAAEHPNPLSGVLLGDRAPAPPKPVFDHPALSTLDDSQRQAALLALGAPQLALVHGPPGTGKTWLITALLQALVDQGDRPWALADSNAAVDHLALQASARGLSVVRLGHVGRMRPEVAALGIEARIAAHPLAAPLATLDRDISRAYADGSPRARAEARELKKERERLWRHAREAVLQDAQVIASTLGTLARAAPDLPPARTAIVDEATQAIEPAVWSAVPWVQRLVLVGDPHQLGPVVLQPNNPLQRSLLDRLLDPALPDEARPPLPVLGLQRRMHQAIQALVDPVYAGRLSPHATVADHLLAELPGVAATPLTTRPVLWVDTAGAGLAEEEDPLTRSLFNPGEVRLVALAVHELLAAGVPRSDLGVIAPYSAQVARLAAALPEVEVATVNAFQGREKEALICTFVRSNPLGEVGFVADPRRLTVALTRARRLLLCVGDSATLASVRGFAALFEHLDTHDDLASAWEPPWSEAM